MIRGYTVKLNHAKIGKAMTAYTLISIDYNVLKQAKISQEELGKKLRAYEEVEDLAMVTGSFDMVVKIRVKDIKEMDRFVTHTLRGYKGVGATQTLMILHEL